MALPVCQTTPVQSREELCAKLRAVKPVTSAGDRETLDVALSSGARVRLEVGNSLLQLSGFWPIEQGPKSSFAWSMGASTLSVGGLRSGQRYTVSGARTPLYTVDIEVLDAAGRGTMTLTPMGGASQEAAIEQTAVHVAGLLVADSNGTVPIGVQVQTWRPSDRGSNDTRELGVGISAVSIQVAR